MKIRDDRLTGLGACGARHHRLRRAGFTLTEMIVAIGLLLLVMGMASAVFKVTLDGTSELQGRSEVDRSIRMLKRIMARDLGRIDPRRSVMAIQGNPAPAYWNKAQREADTNGDPLDEALPPDLADAERQNPTLGYEPLMQHLGFDPSTEDDDLLQPPRADILMFVTQLPEAKSYLDPEIQSDGPVMVVYNHAELGRLNDEGRAQVDPGCGPGNGTSVCNSNPLNDWAQDPVKIPDLQSGADTNRQIFASEWHLARRALLLKNSPDPKDPFGSGEQDAQDRFAHILSPTNPAENSNVDNPAILFPYERHYLEWVRGGGMDVIAPARRDVDGAYDTNSVSGLHISSRVQDFIFDYEIPNRYFGFGLPADLLSLDVFSDAAGIPGAAVVPNRTFTVGGFGQPGNMYFRGGLPAYWLARSKLDPDPPASMLHRLGHAFMENCASFKVEWTPNDVRLDRAGLPEVLWIDPFKEPGKTRLGNSVTDAPINAFTANNVDKPLHLDEFEIMAQKMCPERDTELWENDCLGTEDPSPFEAVGGSLLHQVHQSMIPRFGLSRPDPDENTPTPIVPFDQVNVFDADPSTLDVIEPSHNTHAWFSRDVEFGVYPGSNDPTTLLPKTADNVDPAWPRALRITVDLYPPGIKDDGSFGLPVRHVFVLPIGAHGDTKKKLG